MTASYRYVLLQIRDAHDPMRQQETRCFAEALDVPCSAIRVWSLLEGAPPWDWIESAQATFIGGAGRYSVVQGGDWLPDILEFLRQLCRRKLPLFASCWGFQALAMALGGQVITDLRLAELGTLPVTLTEFGAVDPLFCSLPARFLAAMGHQDIVVRVPPEAVVLASTDKVTHQAFRLANAPIYATQFHPELSRATFIERACAYPEYITQIAEASVQEFIDGCCETPHVASLLKRFVAGLEKSTGLKRPIVE